MRSRQGLAWNTVGERTLLRVREAISEGSPRQLRPGSAEKHAQDAAEGLCAYPLLNEENPLTGWLVASENDPRARSEEPGGQQQPFQLILLYAIEVHKR
jgi:hypothetical protein